MSELKDVFLSDFLYPCATYVVKRLGLSMSPISLYAFPAEKLKEDELSNLQIGDVVIWDWRKNEPPSEVVLSISNKGPVTSKQYRGRHYGVYEGNGIVSDITFYGDSTTPCIRQMYLHDKKTDPVEVIRYTTLKDGE